jgi:hypothetical protein
MSQHNPYAPSKATMAGRTAAPAVDSEARVWRDGKIVVMRHDSSLPHRCIKCNEPSDEPTKVRAVYWMNPFLYLLFLISALILIIVYFIVRKKAEIDPGLCARHKNRRMIALTYGWVVSLIGLFSIFAAIGSDSPTPALIGGLLLLSAIIVGISMGRLVYAKKITSDEVRLGGFCKEYLDDLPEYPG